VGTLGRWFSLFFWGGKGEFYAQLSLSKFKKKKGEFYAQLSSFINELLKADADLKVVSSSVIFFGGG
jgi:hypothetical protein